jgi:hypothetical protein
MIIKICSRNVSIPYLNTRNQSLYDKDVYYRKKVQYVYLISDNIVTQIEYSSKFGPFPFKSSGLIVKISDDAIAILDDIV